MKFPKYQAFATLAFLIFSWSAWGQENTNREVDIHKNVKLIESAIPEDFPKELVQDYKNFLPILEESLKENTTDQSESCAVTVRVTAAVKEIGAAKTKRPMASIAAFRKNSKQEFLGSFLLYSYINSGPVNKEETTGFVKKQILDPVACPKED
jgi:hypothetical protein